MKNYFISRKLVFKRGGIEYNQFLNELFKLNVDFYTRDGQCNINKLVDNKVTSMVRTFRFKSESDYVSAMIVK